MTLPEAILMLLRSTRGEALTLAELVHELAILRHAGREMPRVTKAEGRIALETLEAGRQVRREGEQWFYVPVTGPAQGRLFNE